MAMRRKTSLIWNHFTQNDDNKTGKCNYCSTNIVTSGGNTGNLSRHLSRKHPTIRVCPILRAPVPEQVVTASQISGAGQLTAITTTSGNQEEYKIDSHLSFPSTSKQNLITDYAHNTKPLPPPRAAQIDEQIMRMIAKEYHPLRMVDGEEFRKLINMLNPRYTPPTRKTMSNVVLPQLHLKVHGKVEQSVAAALAVCLTTDAWTSIKNESFLAVTGHYIDEDSKLCSTLLCCIQYEERHTSENLCAFLKAEMDRWKIAHKVAAVVSDNASNIVAAIHSGGWRHIGCFAHTLNLVVQAGISEIQSTVLKVKHIVEFFKCSPQAQGKLQEMQKQMQMTVLKLKQDVVTRWNSTYDMLDRFFSSKDAVVATLALLRSDLSLTIEEWNIVEEAIPILKTFYEVAKEISTESQVSLSKVIVYCRLLNHHIGQYNQKSHSLKIKNMIFVLESQIQRRFYDKNHIESNVLYAEATILDPRFKNRGFRDISKCEKAISDLKNKVGSITQPTSTATNSGSSLPHPQQAEIPISSAPSVSVWQPFDNEVSALVPHNRVAAGIVEVDFYMKEPLLSRSENPLKWWKDQKQVYPILYSYSLKRLNLVATSVPCERTFSKAGMIMTETRSRLQSKKLAELLFIASND